MDKPADSQNNANSGEDQSVGQSTRRLLRDLIHNLQEEKEKFSPLRPKTDKAREISEAPLDIPQNDMALEYAAALEEVVIEGPGGTTKKKIKDLWDNLKTQLMNEENAQAEQKATVQPEKMPLPQIQLTSPAAKKANPAISPPLGLGKSKIILSQEEHDKLKALRKMK